MLLVYAQNNGTANAARAKLATPVSVANQRRYTLQHLMEASERQLEKVARQGSDQETRVAQRILECPVEFLHWEHQHAHILRGVAAASCAHQQKRLLLAATLSLLHRKSLFEYLHDYRVHDYQRELLLMHFHGGNDYVKAMVIEHGNYLRSAASHTCSTFVGRRLMHDPMFAKPLEDYATLYAGYFSTYCNLLLSKSSADSHLGMMVYKLKCQLGQRRNNLLNGVSLPH